MKWNSRGEDYSNHVNRAVVQDQVIRIHIFIDFIEANRADKGIQHE